MRISKVTPYLHRLLLGLGALTLATCSLSPLFVRGASAQATNAAEAPLIELPLGAIPPLYSKLSSAGFPNSLESVVSGLRAEFAEDRSAGPNQEKLQQLMSELSGREAKALNGKAPQRVHLLRALILLSMNDPKAALQSISRGLRLKASDPDAVFLKGWVLLTLKDLPNGLDALEESRWFGKLEQFPEPLLHYGRAAGLAQQKNLPKAVEALSTAGAGGEFPSLIKTQLSRIELARGNRPQALKAAREAASASNDNDAKLQLVRALLEGSDKLLDAGNFVEADKLSASLLESAAPGSKDYDEILPLRVKSLLAANKHESAKKLVVAALKQSPSNLEWQRLEKQVGIEAAAAK